MKDYQKPEVLICRFLPEDLITASTAVGAVESIKSQMEEADVFASDSVKWSEWGKS